MEPHHLHTHRPHAASFSPKEAQHILVYGSHDQENLSDAGNSNGACSQTTVWEVMWEVAMAL